MTRLRPATPARGRRHRLASRGRRLRLIAALVLLACSPLPAQKAAPPAVAPAPADREPNPYLAFLPPGAEPSWPFWNQEMRRRARERRRRLPPIARASLTLAETEAIGTRGGNDHPLLAESLSGFGSAPFQNYAATLTGSLFSPAIGLAPALEPDGAIPEARVLDLSEGVRHTLDAVIGDGLHGSAASGRGDFDFYRIVTDDGYRWLSVAARAAASSPDFDPVALVYDSTGALLAYHDDTIVDGFLVDLDVSFDLLLERAGEYFVAIGGWSVPPVTEPGNPFDPGSGPGAGSEGDYTLTVALALDEARDLDYFAIPLRTGDVLGAVLSGGDAELSLIEPSGQLAVATRGDLSALYPIPSPLPGGGDAALGHVAAYSGVYRLGVGQASSRHPGDYRVDVQVARPPLDGSAPRRQRLFVDLDGAVVDRAWFTSGPPDPVTLSPLSSYLSGWGLEGREDELIDAILTTVREKIQSHVRSRGGNGDYSSSGRAGDFDIEILSSRDDPDPEEAAAGGAGDTARLVLGGSIDELRLETVGIAQAVDVGNFESALTGVVLLDLLSSPAEVGSSLNGIELADGTDRLALVGDVLGKLIVHEAGHLFGNFHTERDGSRDIIMDRGGRIELIAGVGEDEIWNTSDDVEVDLADDVYEPREGFSGLERTLEVVSFDLPVGGSRAELVVAPERIQYAALPVGQQEIRGLLIGNAGSADLAISAGTILPAPSSFALLDPLPTSLGPGGSATVELAFLATVDGTDEARLEFATDLPSSAVSVELNGSGGIPVAAFDRASHDFGSIEYGAGASSLTDTMTLSNSGAGPLLIRGAVLTGAHPGRFEVELDSTPLAAGEARQVTVTFRPRGAVRSSRALLQVITNDPLRPSVDVRLSGRAEGPDAAVFPPPPAFYIGGPELGSQRTRLFELRNLGTRPLATTAIRLADDDLGQFSLDAPSQPLTMAPHETVVFEASFRPIETGLATATLEVLSDDPETPLLTLILWGVGTRAEIVVAPLDVDFGPVAPGTQALERLTIRNQGDFTLSGTFTMLGDPEFEVVGNGAFGLLAGGEFQVALRFTPNTATQVAYAELVIASNDPISPVLTIPLRGSASFGIPATSRAASAALIVLLVIGAVLVLGRAGGSP